ncbi:bi-domain-containing oxidoreductase [Echinimonas agarilytica]|uniref:Bi-domain-containing oxidoreductase n=1 Tax=Echinimonas agarilytica TaxID=1215918 RepID=A0AA41W614_9GAMM|nr:bi-domain-containing oxidoreductase [Echinimonas agarilytica]MCM2679199.1 bi-domain-containing oxidoreductase [Echinimonas agarilytica]
MKQLVQYLDSGKTELVDAPDPSPGSHKLLIDSRCTLVSVGTEKMLVSFGKASYLEKARQQPDKVRQVLDKVKTDGLMTTVDAVRSKLAEPIPLGYCHVGTVAEIGGKCHQFQVGQRVVSNGAHASRVCVGENLCAAIPDNVTDEHASFTVLASIGLQGIRLAQPTLGEKVVVIGAGLIGLMTIQMLIANGCEVLAIDFDESKLELAQQFGARTCKAGNDGESVKAALAFTSGVGVDAVLVTASTQSSQPMSDAATMCRKRGRIVLVGVTGLELNRSDFYEKELSFQVSCSYGPGRYDDDYEQQGQDYPIGFVRWTEQRNFEAVLQLISSGKLDVATLISHRFKFNDAIEAYDLLTSNSAVLGVILTYQPTEPVVKVDLSTGLETGNQAIAGKPVMGVIGAGNFSSRVLIPALKANNASLHTLVNRGGLSSTIHGKKAGFQFASSSTDDVFEQSAINTVAVLTRHDSHAELTEQGLQQNKNVFVEKPIAINHEQLQRVKDAHAASSGILMVGFNRRFSPYVVKMKSLLPSDAPKSVVITVNAGHIPAEHWTQDLNVGGGRLMGEACHFIDLARHLVDEVIIEAKISVTHDTQQQVDVPDSFTILLTHADGSHSSIHYLSNGAASFPKERIEVFCQGKVLQLDNFRKLVGFGFNGFKKQSGWRQEKGHAQGISAFLNAIEKGLPSPIDAEELFEVAALSIDLSEQISGS